MERFLPSLFNRQKNLLKFFIIWGFGGFGKWFNFGKNSAYLIMAFTDEQVYQMKRIFWRLEPQTMQSAQYYDESQKERTGYTFAVMNWKREVTHLFQNFNNLTPVRWKIIEKMKKKIPFPLIVEDLGNGIIRIGWKFE